MNYSAHIVIRQNTRTGRTVAGFASSVPCLGSEWRDIASYGRWFGSQMNYKPWAETMARAKKMAQYYSDLAAGK